MLFLLLRIICAPLAVLIGTLAQRRFGNAVGGLIVGLPLVFLPFLWLVGVQYGVNFARSMSIALLVSATAEVALLWVFAYAVRRFSPLRTLGLALFAFAMVAFALEHAHLSIVIAGLLAFASFALALRQWPHFRPIAWTTGRSRLTLRIFVSTSFTVLLISLAGQLGPSLSGVLDAVPLTSLMMAVFTYREHGANASSQFLHGVTKGSFSYVASMLVLAQMLRAGHVLEAFSVSLLVALAVQALIQLWEKLPHLASYVKSLQRPVIFVRHDQQWLNH
jgi:hypothetical protein